MSCDNELANEWASYSEKNASYITIPVIIRSILPLLIKSLNCHAQILFVLPTRFCDVEYAVIHTLIGRFSKSTRRWIVEANFDVKCQENVKEMMTLFTPDSLIRAYQESFIPA